MERQGTERIAGSANGRTIETGGMTVAEQADGEMPEDVAILYSWANLQGAKYRDFSASRREYRAQMRRRAEVLHEDESRAAAEAAANEAAIASVGGASNDRKIEEPRRLQSLVDAEPEGRRAGPAGGEAARRDDPAAPAASTGLRGAEDDNGTATGFSDGRHR